jgi:hypothetical protein
VVEDEDCLHDVGPSGGHGLLADTADLGIGDVVSSLPRLEPTIPQRNTDVAACALSAQHLSPAFARASTADFDSGTGNLLR